MNDEKPSQDAAREAAQHVVDSAESWEHASEESEVRRHLDEGFDEAGVEVPEEEKERLVQQVRDGEGTPIVDVAVPEDG